MIHSAIIHGPMILAYQILHLSYLADSYPELLTGAIRVKCLAQGHVNIYFT
jgi:hypothetical protein